MRWSAPPWRHFRPAGGEESERDSENLELSWKVPLHPMSASLSESHRCPPGWGSKLTLQPSLHQPSTCQRTWRGQEGAWPACPVRGCDNEMASSPGGPSWERGQASRSVQLRTLQILPDCSPRRFSHLPTLHAGLLSSTAAGGQFVKT